MSLVSQIATAATQYRQAAIQCIVNKSDPYNAITMYRNMLAQLPPDVLREAESQLPEEPNIARSFIEDPDGNKETSQIWKYVRAYSYVVERELTKYNVNMMGRMKLGA